jgi:hypothetical protein
MVDPRFFVGKGANGITQKNQNINMGNIQDSSLRFCLKVSNKRNTIIMINISFMMICSENLSKNTKEVATINGEKIILKAQWNINPASTNIKEKLIM